MNISQAGIDLIKRFEGVQLSAYLDSVSIPTIGVGHTIGVKMGDEITPEQCDEFLRADLEDAEFAVNNLVTVPLTQWQHDALVSLVFNIGAGAFQASTLRKVLNRGLYDAAADQILLWNKAGGRIIPGLVKRRTSERMLFLTGAG